MKIARTTIHTATDPVQILEIQRFRYRVYVTEMGIDLPGADHVKGLLTDSLDSSAVHLVATLDGTLAGSVRLNLNQVPRGLEAPLQVHSLPRPFVYCSRFYVMSRWRGSNVASSLSEAAFAKFHQDGVAMAVCHCYPHLLNFYRRLGFHSYAPPFFISGLEDLGPQTPLRCRLVSKSGVQAA